MTVSNQLAPTNQAVSDAGQGHDTTVTLMTCRLFIIWKKKRILGVNRTMWLMDSCRGFFISVKLPQLQVHDTFSKKLLDEWQFWHLICRIFSPLYDIWHKKKIYIWRVQLFPTYRIFRITIILIYLRLICTYLY